MRKVVYSVGVSLDGYIAAPDGSVDWLDRATSKAKGEDFGMGAFFKTIDTVLMGRKTYEHALKMGMAKGGYPGMKNYIFSRTLPPGERDGVEFISGSVAGLIKKLRKSPGKNIWFCGGGELAHAALNDRVVDEITLGLTPILIGGGLPTFPPTFPETELELVECKQYKGGVLGLTYRVVTSQPGHKVKSKAVKTTKRKG
jgi:dihydrofolate reductase